MRLTWVQPEDLLPHALVAAVEDGQDVAEVAARWTGAGGSAEPPVSGASSEPVGAELRALAVELLDELDSLGVPAELAQREPDDLAGIRAQWPSSGEGVAPDPDRLHGAWLGRAVGCLLGKPVEKLPREGIREILESTGRWPLSGYFTGVGLPADVAARWPWNRRSAPTSLAEHIDGMPEDDDLNFALLALRLLETRGSTMDSADVAESWLAYLPAGRVFTAERVAYRNLLLGLVPPGTARRHNPFREWIGAQIRTDVYGWANPGRPDRAAELAWRDARVSHVRNGVYGALWVAAMCATAPVASTVDDVLDAGLAVVPPASRFADAVRFGRDAGREADWELALDRLHARYGHLHWVHVLNNAALVAAALAHGGGDLGRSICAAVMGGWDTDSVGATVGSICGALSGVPPQWTDPLRNTLRTTLAGFDGIGFDELTARTLKVVGR